MSDFTFINPAPMRDGELELRIEKNNPADPTKGYVESNTVGMYVGEKRVGQLSVRLRDTPNLSRFCGHIGYGVDEAYRGNHFAERACRLLWPMMRAYGFREVVITCNPENTPSRRIIERLGGMFTGLEEVPTDHEMYERGARVVNRYVVTL